MTVDWLLCVFQVVLDSQGSLVGLDPLVRLWGQMFLDPLETPASLDWMENMVHTLPQFTFPFLSFFLSPHFSSTPLFLTFICFLLQVSKVLQVHLGPRVQAQPRETEVTLGSQASLAPQVQKENQDVLLALEALVTPAPKVTWSSKP